MSDVNAWLYEPQSTEPQPTPSNPQSAFNPPAWVYFLLLIGAIAICFFALQNKRMVPDDRHVNIDGLHVLIIEESGDRSKLTKEQVAVFNSVKIRSAAEKDGGEVRVIDQDDIRGLGAPWKDLAESVKDRLPAGVIASGRVQLPFKVTDVDSVIENIQKVKERSR